MCVYVGGWTICARCSVHVDSDHSFVEVVLSLDHFVGSGSGGLNSDQIMRPARHAHLNLRPGPQLVILLWSDLMI